MKHSIGINAESCYGVSREEMIPLIKKAGFDCFFTCWDAEADIARFAALAKENELFYESIHAPFSNAANIWEPGEDGRHAAEELLACLQDCAKNNVPIMVVHPNIGFDRHTPNELGVERFAKLAEAAKQYGVQLAFENVEGEEYLKAVLDALYTYSNVGFCLDTGHELCYNLGKDMLDLYGDRLIYLHLDDNTGAANPDEITWLDDLHLLPFDGIVDWRNLMQRLKKHKYTGTFTLELTLRNKPGKHTHDAYAAMPLEAFLKLAHQRALRILEAGK